MQLFRFLASSSLLELCKWRPMACGGASGVRNDSRRRGIARLGGGMGRLGDVLEASWGVLGRLGSILGCLGRFRAVLRAS